MHENFHSKQKGNIGFAATILDLNKRKINVFSEIGDYSKVDLIAEINSKLIKIQVKYVQVQKNGTISLPLRKCGPNKYKYIYTPQDIDIFAIYINDLDKVVYVPASLACKNVNCFIINTGINKLRKNSNHISDFEDFEKILNCVSSHSGPASGF